MIDLCSKWVTFDVKIALIENHVIDENISFVNCQPPLYFNILSMEKFIADLKRHSCILDCYIYGYRIVPNKNVVIKKDIPKIYSASILLKLNKQKRNSARVHDFIRR